MKRGEKNQEKGESKDIYSFFSTRNFGMAE